jgi:basic membrane protein A
MEREGVSIIWVDSDGYETLPAEFRPVLLTSVLKNTQQAMVEIVGDVVGGAFTNEPYVGTLENGGVAIAPYHDLEPLVPAQLQGEIEGLRQAIIAGEIVVESPSTP